MSDDSVGKIPEGYKGEIDLRELFSVLWKGKIAILVVTFLGIILSIGYALSLPNIYTAQAIMAPKGDGSSVSGMAGQLGGLAGLVGMGIGGGDASKTQIALKTMSSRSFFADYIYEDSLVALMASVGWDPTSGELIIDENVYYVQSDIWVRAKPSIQKAYRTFKTRFSISEDNKTGFVTVRVKHYSPITARDWINRMLKAIETSVRERDVSEAEKSIAFLKVESETNSLISLNEVFANLIEEQTKKIVLANASEEYVFQIIDPPVIAELKSEPKRAFIVILGTFLAGVLSVLYVLVRFYGFENKGVAHVG